MKKENCYPCLSLHFKTFYKAFVLRQHIKAAVHRVREKLRKKTEHKELCRKVEAEKSSHFSPELLKRTFSQFGIGVDWTFSFRFRFLYSTIGWEVYSFFLLEKKTWEGRNWKEEKKSRKGKRANLTKISDSGLPFFIDWLTVWILYVLLRAAPKQSKRIWVIWHFEFSVCFSLSLFFFFPFGRWLFFRSFFFAANASTLYTRTYVHR